MEKPLGLGIKPKDMIIMENKIKNLASHLSDIDSESLKHLTMENALAFRALGENLIDKLKGDSGKTDDEVWGEIKDKEISKERVLKLYKGMP